VIDPEKLPDIQPDKRKFWLLRVLTVALFFGGLAAILYGGGLGALAYYGTKNGAETPRLVEAAAQVLIAVLGGFLMMAIGQVFRVILAIEENTRLVAFHTRPRARGPIEPPRRPMPMGAHEREHMRV
jgi:hypothetical protein